MREKSLHLWASLSVAIGLLLAGSAVAQEKSKPDAGKSEAKPPASAPQQPSGKQNADKPANQPSKNADQPKANKSTEKQDKNREKKADKPADKEQDRAADKDSAKDRSRDDSRATDRATPRSTDRTDRATPDNSRTDRKDTDRKNAERKDTDSKNAKDTPKREKDIKPSDLGFTFSDTDNEKGLKISKLSSKSIGSKADFKQGDIIISINDHPVRSQRDFLHWIHAGSHDRIVLIVLRDDREVTLYLEPDVIFEETVVSSGAWLGVDLYDRFATAAVVLKVHPGSPAERAGLRGDDVILAVEGQRINSPDHLGQVIGRMQPGQEVEIRIERDKQDDLVDATLGRRENVSRRTEVLR